MSTKWHRSEPRDVRPFFGVIRAEDAVAEARISLFEGDSPVLDTMFDIDDIDIARLRLRVFPSVMAIDRWRPNGYSLDDFELVVIAKNPFLMDSCIVARFHFGEEISGAVDISPDIVEELGGGRNLTVTVAVCLAKGRDAVPGLPFIVGHWISRKDFVIRSKSTSSMFDVRTRSDEDWIAANFPAKTLYSVENIGGIADDVDAVGVSSIATVYIHVDAYNKMATDKLGETLQPLLSVEIIAQIIEASFDEWSGLEEVPSRSPLGTLLKKMSSSSSVSYEDLRDIVRKRQGARLRAILQDVLGVVRSII